LHLGWVEQLGGGRHIVYRLKRGKELLIPIDLDVYLLKDTDSRNFTYERFNFELINNLADLFSIEELDLFEFGKNKLQDKFKSLDKTFDTILNKTDSFKEITIADIRSVHNELIKNLDITSGIRESGVGITGTKYVPLDNKWQIEEALSKLVGHVQNVTIVPEKALIFLALISYLQPFTDGNKRTSRLVSNAVLLANGYFPLSYRSVDEVEYKKALILFYEQNNIYHLKRIFLQQQQFAIDNYF